MTDREKERRTEVIRNICGAYYAGRCTGDCPECLDRAIKKIEQREGKE